MNSRIECAAAIVFGEWVPIESIEIASDETPESMFLKKEMIAGLSNEGKELIKLILNAPEEMFFLNGNIREQTLQTYCRYKKNWSARTFRRVQKEAKEFINSF